MSLRAQIWKCLAAPLAMSFTFSCAAGPEILITNAPQYRSTSFLSGLVHGVNPGACRVAVFTYSRAAGWTAKSSGSDWLFPIPPNGSWKTDISTGGSDANATRLAALLFHAEFKYPVVQGAATLSTNLFSHALASDIVTVPGGRQRIIRFSGYDWLVDSRTGGPGPNRFSDSTNNVWLDDLGRLHMRITHRSSQWQCAEIYALKSFGYGTYRFQLGSRIDNSNERAVLGLFTYSSDPAFNDREIDIEFGRWANPGDPNNAQFVVQPPTSGHKVRFAVPIDQTNSTHLFTWEPHQISFRSLGQSLSGGPGPVVADWRFASSGVPQAGDETVHLNLWLYQGVPPADGNEVEVVVQSFEFVGG